MARRRDKGEEKRIANERIRALIVLAEKEAIGADADLADRYGQLARRIAMRYQVPFGPYKSRVCRCGTFRRPATGHVRIRQGHIIQHCTCGHIRRRPLGDP